jgi:hypothetical protein
MATVSLKISGEEFTSVDPDDLEVGSDGNLRLRPRHPTFSTAKCILSLDFDDVGAILGVIGVSEVFDAVSGRYTGAGVNRCLLDIASKKYGAAALRYKSTGALLRMHPNEHNPTGFSYEFWNAVADKTYAGASNTIVHSYSNSPNTLQRWRLTFSNEVLTFTTYDGAGNSDGVAADCTGNLVNNQFFLTRLYYDAANTTSKIRVLDGGGTLGSGSSAAAKVMPILGAGDRQGIYFGTNHQYTAPNGNALVAVALDECRVDMFRGWESTTPAVLQAILDGAADVAAIPIYAAQSGTATATFDSDALGSEWDASTIDLDTNATEAPNVGDDGWEMRYEVADVLTGVYSAWMTFAAFRLLPNETGQYLDIEIRANCADGLSDFFPLQFIKIDTIIAGGGVSRSRVVNSGGV